MDRNPGSIGTDGKLHSVALRKESVDRNHPYMAPPYMAAASLSARRAWIEILADTLATLQNTRRSPQGERG